MIKRAGFTLIELIFSMVIVAMVFTVIPKIIYAFNKSDNFSIREDALFNGMSIINMISRLPWDENNTNYNDILHTQNGFIECNETTFYRAGGFVGSRNCENNLSASAISNDGESNWLYYNDVDDFNDLNITSKISGQQVYTISNRVNYIKDDISYTNQKATISLQSLPDFNMTTNLKKIKSDIYYSGKRGKIRHLSQFSYISANIGQLIINKRAWK